MLTVTFCKTPNETHLELLYSRRIFPLFLKKLCFRANYTLQLWAFALVSSSYANLVRSTHFGIQCVHAAEVRTMTKIWKYLFSYDSPQRDIETNGHILRFPHISKYLSFLFALFWSVDMPDIWFWVSGWVLILVTVTANGLVIYFIRTKPGRQILLHSRPHPCWSLFQSQLRLLVLLHHQSLRHDGRLLPCHHKAFAVHVLHDERNCLEDDYHGLEWPISILLFAFHLHLQWQSDIYRVRGNIPSAHFPESAPRYLCRCNFSSPSHWLESHRQTRELIARVRHNHAIWTWVDRTSSHLQYSDCNTGVPPSWSYWWWQPSISRTSEGITTVSAFSPIYVPSLGRSDKWFIWCWLPTLLSVQFSIPSLRVIFKRNYLSCSQGR